VNVTVEATNNLEPGGFHNVTVVAYATDGSRICSKQIGDMAVGKTKVTETANLDCGVKPAVIGVTANETPCDENTSVDIWVYNQSTDEWEFEQLECGESPSQYGG
jgi:hypothetical protein